MALIVELFGPPGAGKTTFAKALAARLRADGREVGLHLSSRPGETGETSLAFGALRRIARPLWELVVSNLGDSGERARDSAARLSPLLEGLGPLTQLRMKQYLFRLSAARAKAEASPGVFIFDQGYLQFAASLLALDEKAGEYDVRAAVRAIPRSDAALLVVAARGELARRLDHRHEGMGALGRLLEAGAGSSERHLELSQLLRDELEREGWPVLQVRSSAGGGFAEEVDWAASNIDWRPEESRPLAAATRTEVGS